MHDAKKIPCKSNILNNNFVLIKSPLKKPEFEPEDTGKGRKKEVSSEYARIEMLDNLCRLTLNFMVIGSRQKKEGIIYYDS